MANLTNYFIPEDFATDDSIERKQAEIALKTVYILVPWGLFSALFAAWLLDSVTAAVLIAISPLMMAVAPLVLRYTGSMNAAHLFILAPMFVAFTGWSVATGGVMAPGTSWLLMLPLLALLFRGLWTAAIWLVAVLSTWIALYAGGYFGVIPPADLTADRFQSRRMIELFCLGTTIFVLFYLKDNLQNWLIAIVEAKEAKTRAVFETAPDGILTLDLDGTICSANQAAARIFDTATSQLIGSNIEYLVESLTSQQLGTDSERLLQFGANEEHCGRRDGDEFPIEIAFGLLDHGDEPRQIILVLRDITDRKQAERQLRQARDDALEASRAKSTFLAKMSHELRTPLNAVIGYSEMMAEELDATNRDNPAVADLADQFLPDLTRVQSAGRHLLSIVNDILDLSKIEAGQVELHTEDVDVPRLVDDVATTIRPLARDNDNTLEIDIDDDIEPMHSDSTKVRQILFNVLSNACKFTEGGRVQLEVRADDEAEHIVFVVADTGIGMTEEQLEEVFQAFRQADDSTTRKFDGTGLGLTITSRFTELLDGHIDVTSTPDVGTTFTIRLARRLDVEPPSPSHQPSSSPALSAEPHR